MICKNNCIALGLQRPVQPGITSDKVCERGQEPDMHTVDATQ